MIQKNLFGKNYTKGKIGEYLAINKFQKLKFVWECNIDKDNHHDFDFVVNGKKVEVKLASASFFGFKTHHPYGRWVFNYTREKDKFDFLVCIGQTKDRTVYMIIPREKIKGEKAIAVYPFSKTENWKYYSSFINRWDLLK